ncbi:MAG TPA: riboflavin synthase [Gammaproteobacteria bacterium]|nr:riboflavin synthase [Gammaproteobacteria bacterium]
MFTGIVQTIGEVAAIDGGADKRIEILAPGLDFATGDSIAVNGCCLTVAAVMEGGFAADVSRETLACTTLGGWMRGMPVNLEAAAKPATLLGGHLVLGHVDGVGAIRERHDDARSVRLKIELPAALARYIAAKGSVCIDGVSLTVNETGGAHFGVNIVPYTLDHTVIRDYAPGTRVNIECDIIARYVERLLDGAAAAPMMLMDGAV